MTGAGPAEEGGSSTADGTAAWKTATYENRFPRAAADVELALTNRVLLTAGFGDYLTRWGGDEMPGNPTRSLVRVTEQCAPNCPLNGNIPNLTYRSANWASHWMGQHNWNASMTYVTGAHNMKAATRARSTPTTSSISPTTRRSSTASTTAFPNLITLTLHSNLRKLRTRYHAVYAQEQWTRAA